MKKAKAQPKQRTQSKMHTVNLRGVLLSLLIALVFLGPFLQGLYWPHVKLLFVLAFLALGLVWLLAGPSHNVGRWPVALVPALGIVAVYAVGLYTPASVNGAINGLLLWCGLVTAYWLFTSLKVSDRERTWLLGAIVTSGVLLALAGLAAYTDVHHVWPSLIQGDRMAAGFEYANATASHFMVGLLLVFVMGVGEQNFVKRALWSAAGIVLWPAFLLTLSRGGWLTLGIVALVMIVANIRRLSSLISYMTCVTVPGLAATALLVTLRDWRALVATMVLAGIGSAFDAGVARRHYKIFAGVVLVMGIVGAGAITVGVLGGENVAQILPQEIATTFQRMTLRGLLDDGRFVFIADGLQAFRAAPLLGYGGGAWNAVYHAFQSFHYGTRRAHADWLDILLDTGAVGLVFYVAFLGLSFHAAWRHRQSPTAAAVLFGSAGIAFHSLGEALLAFPAMYVSLIALLGSIPQSKESGVLSEKASRALRIGVITALSGLSLLGGSFLLAELEMRALRNVTNAAEQQAVVRSIERVLALNPWHNDARMKLADVLWEDAAARGRLRANLRAALRAEPYDPRLTNYMGHFYSDQRNFAEALRYHQESLHLQPRNVQNYETLAFAAASAAFEAKADGEEYKRYLEMAFQAVQNFRSVREKIPPQLLRQSAVPFEMTQVLSLALGKAHALSGAYTYAMYSLQEAIAGSEPAINFPASLWLARVYQKLGRFAEAEPLLAKHRPSAHFAAYWDALVRVVP